MQRGFLAGKLFSTYGFKANPKYQEQSVAGAFKRAVADNFMRDSVRFDALNFNWNLKEFDVSDTCALLLQRYSSAYAFGLLENGF